MKPRPSSTTSGDGSAGRRSRRLIALAGVLLLPLCASCGKSSEPLVVERRTKPIERLHPPLPQPVVPIEVEVHVLTPEVMAELHRQAAEGRRGPVVFFGFDEQDYLSMGRWMQDVLRYIEQMRAVVDHYREKNPEEGK